MKKASSLLELIIAIVVMGIAVISFPTVLMQTQSNNTFALQSEVLLGVRVKLGDILTYRWDENSLVDDKIFVLVTDGDSELNATAGTTRRIGHVNADKRRKFSPDLNSSTPVANLGSDSGDLDDIDDFDGSVETLQATTESTNLDYRFTDYNITTSVVYVDDTANYSGTTLSFTLKDSNISHTSSIKMITLSVSGTDIPFKLRSYACNIGELELLRKTW